MGIIGKILGLFGFRPSSKTRSLPKLDTRKYDHFGKAGSIPRHAILSDPLGDPILSKNQTKFESAKKKILSDLTPGRERLEIEYVAETDEYTIDSP